MKGKYFLICLNANVVSSWTLSHSLPILQSDDQHHDVYENRGQEEEFKGSIIITNTHYMYFTMWEKITFKKWKSLHSIDSRAES